MKTYQSPKISIDRFSEDSVIAAVSAIFPTPQKLRNSYASMESLTLSKLLE